MANPTTKAELLTKIQKSYTEFEALLAPLSPAQLTTPGVNGDWSIKDILVHVATWQARAALILEAASRGETPRLTPPVTNEEEMDRFNDEIFLTHRTQPLDDVWSSFRASYQQLLAATEVLSEEDLFDAQRFPWRKGEPLWKLVGGDTFEHYPEHISMIEEWQVRQKA